MWTYSIVDSVSQVIVSKLLANESFIAKLADGLMKDGVIDAIKQNVYDACALDSQTFLTAVESLESRVDDLDKENKALRDEMDSRWNNTAGVIAWLCTGSLNQRKTPEKLCWKYSTTDVRVTPQCIDRSHRLGRQQPSTDKPRPVIVKFMSYETRRQVFSAKRRLKGCKAVITENLTKRRTEMLNRTRTQPGVKCAWTTDGRIVCLLENGDKCTIVTERDLTQMHRHQ